jgi:MlaA lipoprotein
VLPFFGPSNGRDVVGRVGDLFTDPVFYIDPNSTRYAVWGTRIVNRRADLLDASKVLETAALDPYEFVRDAYLQRRRNLINDGTSPPPGRDFPDAPPKSPDAPPKSPGTPPKSPGASLERDYPSTGEPTGSGSLLVSGDANVAVQAAFPQGALPEPAPLKKPVMQVAESEGTPPPPNLAQFWRALKLNFTTKQ